MSGHRLRRADGKAVRLPAEHVFEGRGFGAITERCRCRVRVEILNLMWPQAGVLKCRGHDTSAPFTVFGRRGHVMRVGAHTKANNLRHRRRTAPGRVLE